MELLSSIYTTVVALGIPCGILLYLIFFKRKYLVPFLVGVLTFTIFQVLTRMPLIQLVIPQYSWYFDLVYNYTFWYVLALGFSAALFEELGRFLMMKLLLKKHHTFNDGIMFGLGHGGIEAVLLVGLNALLIIIDYQGISGAPLSMFMAGTERLSTLVLHVLWSVMVMRTVIDKKYHYLIMAFLMHGLLDSGITLLQVSGVNTILLEGLMAILALFAVYYLTRLKKEWR